MQRRRGRLTWAHSAMTTSSVAKALSRSPRLALKYHSPDSKKLTSYSVTITMRPRVTRRLTLRSSSKTFTSSLKSTPSKGMLKCRSSRLRLALNMRATSSRKTRRPAKWTINLLLLPRRTTTRSSRNTTTGRLQVWKTKIVVESQNLCRQTPLSTELMMKNSIFRAGISTRTKR